MSFFEPRSQPERPPRPTRWSSAWTSPHNEVGVVVPERAILLHRDDLAVVFTDIVAYSTGFTGDLKIVWRYDDLPGDVGRIELFHLQTHHAGAYRGGELRPEFLRFGVEFSDGRRATNLEERQSEEEDDDTVHLHTHGGGGGGSQMSWHYWVNPLPPSGPVTFAIEWPSFDVELTRHLVDAAPILEAASRSQPFWDDPVSEDEDEDDS